MSEYNETVHDNATPAVSALLGVLTAAQDVARLLPEEPADFRAQVIDALAIAEIAVLRFNLELGYAGDDDPVTDADEMA